jgi:phenylalanyl-tRNA synthetase beta chain
MANIKFSKKQFERDIGKLNEEMKEKIALFGTPFESSNDKEIEIEVFPNRPDMLSYQGFKRSFLSFLGRKVGLKKYDIHKPEKDYKVYVNSFAKEVRPFTCCAIVKRLRLNDNKIKELIDLQEKLHFTFGRKRRKFAVGVYSLDKIKLPITFTALEPDKIKFVRISL